LEDGVVAAVGDYATVYWALGRDVGDEMDYVDDAGNIFRIKIVGMIGNSIFQGNLLIDNRDFEERFSSVSGYKVLLVDSPASMAKKTADKLEFSLQDFGVDISPASDKLIEFAAVENTYLSIFQLLGGLGLALGTLGLGFVVAINVLQRRSELAMLKAVGFNDGELKYLIFLEHLALVVMGMFFGVVSALIAVMPALALPGAKIPVLSLSITVLLIALSATVWIWFAVKAALSLPLLEAICDE
jgi:putative ABC transport system permease protein